MERLVERYIREGILHEEPLHRNQHAYQEGKSCETALHQPVSRIEDSLASKEIALCAFLDIGAFDNTSYESIIRSAHTICRWIEATLQSCQIQANLVGEIIEVKATRGSPQGGVLSPLLWSLVVKPSSQTEQ
jgi:hypothetical protein